MSVTEQRYQAVLDVIAEGRAVMEVGSQWGVNRRTVHRWLARYEAAGLEGLPDRSHHTLRGSQASIICGLSMSGRRTSASMQALGGAPQRPAAS